MKNITLSEVEVSELIEMYETEIDRAQRRINNLQSILKKLRSDADENAKVTKAKKVAVAKVQPIAEMKVEKAEILPSVVAKDTKKQKVAKTGQKKETKKKNVKNKAIAPKYKAIKGGVGGEKVKWSDTIIGILNDKKVPMLSSEIATEAISRLEIEKDNVARAKSAVSTNITKLLKVNKVVKQPIEGKKGSLFSLGK